MPWIVLIVVAMLILIVVLILPTSIVDKLSGVAVGIGMTFTAYSLYITVKEQQRVVRRRRIDRDNDYWMKIFTTFMSQPSLDKMHGEIYGNSISTDEHTMFSMMMQVVDNILEEPDYDIDDIDKPWTSSIKKWISHPMFPVFWRNNKDEFSYNTQVFIDSISNT